MPCDKILTSSSIRFSGISSTLNFSISFKICFFANLPKEFLYSSLICFDTKFFKSSKSLAPKFFAKLSLIFTSSGFFTFNYFAVKFCFFIC